jgi:tripartite-type tricarboxylate transporter receptor subunit TctC
MRRREFITLLCGAAVLGCAILTAAQTAGAQSFPARPLALVVPFAAGGPSDVAGRIVAQGLSEKLGQQVIVENPAGAGGTLGSLRVAKAPPDGYQFVIGNSGTHAWSQALYKKPPYNTVTDFAPLGLVVEAPRAIITPKNFPANTLPELIAYVKANQNTVKYGSAGAGSASHVSCILLNAALGIDVVHIPYRGLGPAMQDLIAGRIDYMCDSPSTSWPQIETNNVKAIATTRLSWVGPLFLSTIRQETPCRFSSAAMNKPTGPAPTTSTWVLAAIRYPLVPAIRADSTQSRR